MLKFQNIKVQIHLLAQNHVNIWHKRTTLYQAIQIKLLVEGTGLNAKVLPRMFGVFSRSLQLCKLLLFCK